MDSAMEDCLELALNLEKNQHKQSSYKTRCHKAAHAATKGWANETGLLACSPADGINIVAASLLANVVDAVMVLHMKADTSGQGRRPTICTVVQGPQTLHSPMTSKHLETFSNSVQTRLECGRRLPWITELCLCCRYVKL